jgi:AraC-like DNA-binding protein
MQYLTNWRMQLAATHLLSGRAGIAEVAERVGYASEAAFSRAFKRAVGLSPGDWRNDRKGRAVGYAAPTAPGGAPAH